MGKRRRSSSKLILPSAEIISLVVWFSSPSSFLISAARAATSEAQEFFLSKEKISSFSFLTSAAKGFKAEFVFFLCSDILFSQAKISRCLKPKKFRAAFFNWPRYSPFFSSLSFSLFKIFNCGPSSASIERTFSRFSPAFFKRKAA